MTFNAIYRIMALLISGMAPLCLLADGGGSPQRRFTTSTGAAIKVALDSLYNGHNYVEFIPQPGTEVGFSVTRPDADDPATCLAVAAAFTGDDLTSICGDHVVGGKRLKGYPDITTTGHLLINGTTGRISIAPNSSLEADIDTAVTTGGHLFQQCLIVEDGEPHPERIPAAIIERKAHIIFRAACIKANGQFAIVQGADDQYADEFVEGLATIGVTQAIYLDMGSWAYGWYRTDLGADAVELSQRFDNTAHQSNWLVVRATAK